MAEITVEVGEKELRFEVGMDDYNQFINDTLPNDKVNPAFNFLSRTVVADDKEEFKAIVMVDGKVNGMVAMTIVGVVVGEIGGEAKISVKKPSNSPSK
jgi:hypothetical protein